jgi:hypothetical protein
MDSLNGEVAEVEIGDCPSGTVLAVATQNSSYRLTVRNPLTGNSLIEGGRFFAEPTAGRVDGSVDAGGVFHAGRIQVGERLQLFGSETPVTTSRVASIVVEP